MTKEKNGVLFELITIPDLSLTKYSSLGGGNSEEILEKHNGLLRQFSRKPNSSLHLFYDYDPTRADGSRLKIYLLVREYGLSCGDALGDARELVESSPIAPFFEDLLPIIPTNDESFVQIKRGERADCSVSLSRLQRIVFQNNQESGFCVCSALLKATKFINPTPPHPEAKNGYYVQPEFSESEKSRLFSMMKLMEALGNRALYRVDLYPSMHAEELRSDLPLSIIREKKDNCGLGRNYELESIEKSYDKLLEKVDASPLFHTNIFVFSDSKETGRAILEAASSEAVKKGSCDLAHFEGCFDSFTFLKEDLNFDKIHDVDGRFVATHHQNVDRNPGVYIIDSKAISFRHSYIATEFTLEEASAFFRFPVLEDGEFIQRRKETAPLPFDVKSKNKHALYLGRDNNNQSVFFDEKLLKKHAFISGVPGSGKTVTMCHIATSLAKDGIPFTVLEPAKTEYRAILNNASSVQKVRIFSPGANTPFPLRINPFEMPIGISVGHHINRLCQVFEGAFPLEGALPFLLDRAIESVYSQNGWNSKMIRRGDEDLEFPTLSMLYDQIQRELEKESYDGEVGGNLKSAIHMRIGGLLRRELGDIFDVPVSTIEPSEWLTMMSIVELESLGSTQSNFLTLLLCVLIRESLMANPSYSGDIRHVLFIEEAHNLIGPEASVVTGEHADPKQAATAFISDMLREVRALGEGIIIADQLPSAIAAEVLKNTGLKISMRMTSADDRELLGSMMMANPAQLENMAVADPGTALVMYEGLQRPFFVKMTEWLNDPLFDDYIEDKEDREKAKTPKQNDELRQHILKSTESLANRSWYYRLGVITFWIDIQSIRTRIEDICMRVDEALHAIEEFRKNSLTSHAKNEGNAAFRNAKAALNKESADINVILRQYGFDDMDDMRLRLELALQNLDLKALNWIPFLNKYGNKLPTPNDLLKYCQTNRDIALKSLEWQIAYAYLEVLYAVCSRQCDPRMGDELENGKAASIVNKIGMQLVDYANYRWNDADWLQYRNL